MKTKVISHKYLASLFSYNPNDGLFTRIKARQGTNGAIDLINHVRTDNRINNLRVVTSSENQRNVSRRKDNKSGQVGVSWESRRGKWFVRIVTNEGNKFLGYRKELSDAIKLRKEAEIKYGYHVNHGKLVIF